MVNIYMIFQFKSTTSFYQVLQSVTLSGFAWPLRFRLNTIYGANHTELNEFLIKLCGCDIVGKQGTVLTRSVSVRSELLCTCIIKD